MNFFPEKIDSYRILKTKNKISQTPAFVYDEVIVVDKLTALSKVRSNSGCKILYSIKAVPLIGLLKMMSKYVDGFSASSLFESQIAKEVLNGLSDYKKTVHITSPGLREEDVKLIVDYADYISFNSISQWKQYEKIVDGKLKYGLRVNPEKSFARDKRYDPCRKYSKLGVPISALANDELNEIQGFHLHNNCESNDFTELKKTLDHVCNLIVPEFKQIRWVNLGGGYFFDSMEQLDELEKIIKSMKDKYTLDVFIEPGRGIVGSSGFLVTSVVDLFESDGKKIAILDTTVNHLPEVFEYQYKPEVVEENLDGSFEYRLAGASCLSGDLFGDYQFTQKLDIGSRLTFKNVGAYMFVKANTFNGINFPAIYILDEAGEVSLEKEFSYTDFRKRF